MDEARKKAAGLLRAAAHQMRKLAGFVENRGPVINLDKLRKAGSGGRRTS